jgi:hypothetical protein
MGSRNYSSWPNSKPDFARLKKRRHRQKVEPMMHESFKRRLADLEEARKLQDAPPKMISIGFVGVEPTVAWTGPSLLRERRPIILD